MIILVVSIVTAILAPILTQLLYFASSRQREYLADASAARFTRYPEGLASALEKIASNQSEKFSKSRTLAPMYIVNPLAATGKQKNLFSTHPPTAERVRILRGMTSSSSLMAYEQAYRQLHGDQGIIGAATLKSTEEQGIRQAGAPGQNVKKGMRDAKNILQRAAGYGLLTCSCGIKMKIPKDTDHNSVKCPRCGKVHKIPLELLSAAAIALNENAAKKINSAAGFGNK
jgi:heat shock protein HtpX